jgi:hypothetical protein
MKRSNVDLAAAARVTGDEAFVRGDGAKTSKRQDVKEPKRRMTIYLPEEVALALERLGVEERESTSGLVERAVKALLKPAKR